MSWFLVLAVLAIVIGLVAVDFLTLWSIGRRAKSAWWSRGSAVAVVVGAVTGFISGIFVRWHPAADVEYVGFPIPGMMLLYEDGRWVDYVGPTVLICPVLNALLGATVFLLPFLLGLLVCRVTWHDRRTESPSP